MLDETGNTILLYLLSHINETVSSKKLADHCKVSLSTIRAKLGWLNEELNDYGMHIEAKQSLGCRLIINDSSKADKIVQQLAYSLRRKRFNAKSKYFRSNYIVRRLLTANGYVPIEKLCDELFYSSSTIIRDINLAQAHLKNYGLAISLKKNHGFYVEGDEFLKRIVLLIHHKKFLHLDSQQKKEESAFNDYFLPQCVELVREKIYKTLEKYPQLEFSFLNFPKIYNSVILTKVRHIYTESIQFTEEQLNEICNSSAYFCAQDILNSLEDFLEFHPSNIDYCALAAIMLGYRSISSFKQLDECRKVNVIETGKRLLDKLITKENLNPGIFTPFDYESFACNLEISRYKKLLNTPFDQEFFYAIEGGPAINADMCCSLISIIKEELNLDVDSSYVSTNLIFFDRIFTNSPYSPIHIKALVISLYGIEFAKTAAAYLARKYNRYFESIEVLEYANANGIDLNCYDLVITDILTDKLNSDKTISLNLAKQDFLRDHFEKYLHQCTKKNLNELIKQRHYITDFKDKEEIYNFIVEILGTEAGSSSEFIQDMKDRNAIFSAERDNGLAFITTHKKKLQASCMIIIANKNPILWDKKECQYFFFYYRSTNKLISSEMLNRELKSILKKTPEDLSLLLSQETDIISLLAPKNYS